MRIGIDLTSWANGRGYGRFTRELVAALLELGSGHEFVLFIEAENLDRILHLSMRKSVEIVPVALSAVPSEAAGASGARSPADLLRLGRAVTRQAPDVFFFPTVYSWFPVPRRIPQVVGIHDAIAERFPELCFAGARARLFWNLKVRWARRRARLVLTVSEAARRDLESVLGIAADRIRVAVEAPSAGFTPVADRAEARSAATAFGLGEGEDYFLYLGGFNPHKQVDLLIESFARVAADRPRLKLFLAGTLDKDVFHGDLGRLMTLRRELGLEERIVFTGFVSDEQYRLLAAGALAMVLPSLCEGFGLPAVEAAACGTAVIATSDSPLPEILEGGGLFIDPRRVEELDAALARLADDDALRLRLAAKALERAGELSWQTCAQRCLEALEEAV